MPGRSRWRRGNRRSSPIFPKEFIRGLVHFDGSRSADRVRHGLKNGERWYGYSRYFFTNESADIMGLFTDALERLGIEWR
jgi:hypothetical protein